MTLLERNGWLGGKAAVLEQDGFRFDMGPTILTLPSILRRIFVEARKELEDYVQLIPLDPQWRCMFDDGAQLDLVANTRAMQARLNSFTGGSRLVSQGYGEFMRISERLHDVSNRFFFWKSVGSIRDTLDIGKSFDRGVLADVLSLRMGSSVAGLVRKCVPDERGGADGRPLHTICGFGPPRFPGGAVRYCPHANQ